MTKTNEKILVAQSVLEQFFSGWNDFYFLELGEGPVCSSKISVQDVLRPAIKRYSQGYIDRPLLLPFYDSSEKFVCWFACAHSESDLLALVDELNAFIGPSFAEFDVIGTSFNGGKDLVRQGLLGAGLHVVTFHASTPKLDDRIVERWGVYWTLLEQQPSRPRVELRTFSQLRSEFDRALVAHNEKDAQSAINALREQHGLSAENRAFLEIRLHASFGRWDRILAHPQWDEILKVRLPPETYGDIWEALYETYLSELESSGCADDLIKRFAESVRIIASSLLRSRGRSRRPAALKALILNELGQGTPSVELCATLLEQLSDNAFGASTLSVRVLVDALQPNAGFELALQEIDLERYEQAFVLLLPLSDNNEVLRALLRCAKEIGDPEHARMVLARLSGSTPSLADQIRANRTRLIADVEKLATEVVTATNVVSLDHGSKLATESNVIDYWRELARSDKAEELLDQTVFAENLASTIEECAIVNDAMFESLYPVWFEWLITRTSPRATLLPVYRGLIEALHVWDRYGDTELELIKQATRHCLLAGLNSAEYASLVNRLGNILLLVRAPGTMAWALDIADLFAVFPCRDPEARLRWISQVVYAAVEYYPRLTVTERTLLHLLANESGLALPQISAFDETSTDLPQHADTDARILLYSLDNRAIQRAADVLSTLFPNARVSTNSDDVCTTRLKSGAQHADWVVFVSSVASHQAFYCIKDALRSDAELLQVDGTGTTRIVERVLTHSRSVLAELN